MFMYLCIYVNEASLLLVGNNYFRLNYVFTLVAVLFLLFIFNERGLLGWVGMRREKGGGGKRKTLNNFN